MDEREIGHSSVSPWLCERPNLEKKLNHEKHEKTVEASRGASTPGPAQPGDSIVQRASTGWAGLWGRDARFHAVHDFRKCL